MKSIPQYTFHKTKYGQELLIDVVNLEHIKKYIEETPVHTLNYYDITCITKGEGLFNIDDQSFMVRPDDIIFSRPGEIRQWEKDYIKEGYALIFEEEFLLSFFNDPDFIRNLSYFQPQRPSSVISLDSNTSKHIIGLINLIKNEIRNQEIKDKHILRALLYEALMFLNRTYQTTYPIIKNCKKDIHSYVNRFIDLVDTDFTQSHLTTYYADKLCITPNYLNEIIKMSTGINAKQYIADRILLEAKKKLTYTDISVSIISEELGFDSASYFIRFFRRKTNLTPLQYRYQSKP